MAQGGGLTGEPRAILDAAGEIACLSRVAVEFKTPSVNGSTGSQPTQ